MGFLNNTFGTQEVHLASESAGKPIGIPVGVKSTDRVKRELLETSYRFDSLTFNIINKQTQLIMHAGFQIKAKTARWQKWYDEFFEDIGFVGEPITTEELVTYIIQDMLMYGNSFVELVYDRSGKKIVDLKMIPEKKMDYAKNNQGHVAIDELGRPIGYTMQLPYGYSARGVGDEVQKKYKSKVKIEPNQIFFLPKRIAHFKLHTYGDRFYGIGLIEPSYQSTQRKMLLEEARTNEIYTRGSNTLIAEVGNPDHEPSDKEISDTLDQIANFKHNRFFAFPYWVKVNTLPVQDNKMVDNMLDYLKINQTASAGIPMALASGEGESANKQTLDTMNFVLELSLENIVKKFSSCFKKYVMGPIAKTNKIPEIAEIDFGDVIAEDKNGKNDRLMNAVRGGVLAPEEVRQHVLFAEDLEEDKKAYEKYRNTEKAKPKKIPSPPFPQEEDTKMSQSQKVELGGYRIVDIPKRFDINKSSQKQLLNYHQNLHVIWNKLEQGYRVGWTFEELYEKHMQIITKFQELNVRHLEPINSLDEIKI